MHPKAKTQLKYEKQKTFLPLMLYGELQLMMLIEISMRSHSTNDILNARRYLADALRALSILNKYAYQMWFGIIHSHTHVWPKSSYKDIFKIKAFPDYMFEEAFHNEVLSWLGI